MRKLTKKLNNNTFSGGNDVNGMDGGGRPRWRSFKKKMSKAGRSLKSGLSTVRRTLHSPFKNQS